MTKRVTVIGSGPGGYKSALWAEEKGLDVTLIEKGEIGGVCTNSGCIPSKALLSVGESIDVVKGAGRRGVDVTLNSIDIDKINKIRNRAIQISRKGIKKHLDESEIEIIKGEAEVVSGTEIKVGGEILESDHIIIATGSKPIVLPFLEIDEDNILTSKGALAPKEIPNSMVIIGGGYIGVEMASIFSSMGTEVTVVELMDRLLPQMDEDLSMGAEKLLKRKRVKVLTRSKVVGYEGKGPFTIKVESMDGDEQREMKADKILCTVGRKPNLPKMDLDILDENGSISVDDRMKTDIETVYAVGDVNGKSMLAHSAYKQAQIAVDDIIGDEQKGFSEYHVPAGLYTHPEIGSVGLTEEQAKKEFKDVQVEKFSVSATGRGSSTGQRLGSAKIIEVEERIVGVHLMCPAAVDIIMEVVVAMRNGMSARELADIIHPHPTFSETIYEAAKKF